MGSHGTYSTNASFMQSPAGARTHPESFCFGSYLQVTGFQHVWVLSPARNVHTLLKCGDRIFLNILCNTHHLSLVNCGLFFQGGSEAEETNSYFSSEGAGLLVCNRSAIRFPEYARRSDTLRGYIWWPARYQKTTCAVPSFSTR